MRAQVVRCTRRSQGLPGQLRATRSGLRHAARQPVIPPPFGRSPDHTPDCGCLTNTRATHLGSGEGAVAPAHRSLVRRPHGARHRSGNHHFVGFPAGLHPAPTHRVGQRRTAWRRKRGRGAIVPPSTPHPRSEVQALDPVDRVSSTAVERRSACRGRALLPRTMSRQLRGSAYAREHLEPILGPESTDDGIQYDQVERPPTAAQLVPPVAAASRLRVGLNPYGRRAPRPDDRNIVSAIGSDARERHAPCHIRPPAREADRCVAANDGAQP